MDNIWLKIAGLLVAVIVGFLVFQSFTEQAGIAQEAVEERETGISDTFDQDDIRMRAEPESVAVKPAQIAEKTRADDSGEPQQAAGDKKVEIASEPVAVERHFRELLVEEQVDAERLFEMVITERKIARMPMMTYKKMIDFCRMIIERYPGTKYEYMAKRTIAQELRPRDRKKYKITKEEVDYESVGLDK